MFRLTRPPPPKVFASPALARERACAREFFARKSPSRSQQRFEWSRVIRLLRQADGQLLKISDGKCAYCESTVGVREGFNLEMFRPKAHAIGREGDVAPDHYWWLAFEWSNLLPSCQACNVAKASRFPIAGPRAPVDATDEALRAEQPLLLDPCLDDPASHLFFDEEGLVSSPTERGRVTIEVLALNREPLVEARRQQITLLRDVFAILRTNNMRQQRSANVAKSATLIASIVGATQPYLAAKRQLLALWIGELPKANKLATALSKMLGVSGPAVRTAITSRAKIKSAQRSFKSHQVEKERYSVEAGSKEAKAAYFGGVRRIERVAIENFKGLRQLEITLPPPSTDRESWLTLVGENATGKSSILQAIALALLGQQHIGKLGLDARVFVTHGETSGSVRVHLTNVSQPIELRYDNRNRQFSVNPPKELVLLLGYGATRLLPRSATTKNTPTRYVRVKNLFNPYARLQNAERWLTNRRLVKAALFEQIAVTLKQLLLLDSSSRILRERFRVRVEVAGHKLSLRELSDGYQSIVALAVDIMMGLAVRWSSMDVAEGVVLIDEIETHLHPRWKMEIVTRLRRVFPKLTFITTTHDPLCLRGLEAGEIVVLRRDQEDGQDNAIRPHVITESIGHLRADQLLTSPLFDLVGTRDPAVRRNLDEVGKRYDELFVKSARTAGEEADLIELRKHIVTQTAGGETVRGRFVEEAVRQTLQQLANEPSSVSALAPMPAEEEVKSAIRSKITELLGSIETTP